MLTSSLIKNYITYNSVKNIFSNTYEFTLEFLHVSNLIEFQFRFLYTLVDATTLEF